MKIRKSNLRLLTCALSVVLIGFAISCSDDPAPPITFDNDDNPESSKVYKKTETSGDGGSSTEQYDYFGVDFPESGSLRISLSSDETLEFSVTLLANEEDIPDFYCHHRDRALEVFNRVLASYNCDDLADANSTHFEEIEQKLLSALETEFQEATLDTETKIKEIIFVVDSCVSSL